MLETLNTVGVVTVEFVTACAFAFADVTVEFEFFLE
jgi:hypothetical protein